MLVYIEYRSRKPDLDLELFHAIVGRGTDDWGKNHPEDVLVLNAGRTWRLGPEPEYLVVYYTAGSGFARFTDWEQIFASGEVDRLEAQTRATGRIEHAGCFFPLAEPIEARGGRYYAEFFDVAPGRTRDDIRTFFEQRRTLHDDFTLHLIADRIGHLGPDPRGLAVWGIPGYEALDRIAEELSDVADPVRLVHAGLYADIGEEIL